MSTKIGSEFQVNTFTIEDQLNSSVASLINGGFVVVWESEAQESDRGVYGQRYDANGSPLGSEFRINTFTLDYQNDPSVASLANGGFVVAWESLGQDGSDNGIYGQRYDADGNPLGTEFRVNTFTDQAQNTPASASLANGGFVVTWTSFEQDGSYGGIYGQRYDADGNPLGTEFRVNTFTDDAQLDSSVASLANGGFVVTWASREQNGNLNFSVIHGQRYDADGNPVGSEFRISTFTDVYQSGHAAVASLADGGFVVTWNSFSFMINESLNDIYGQRYDANGNPIGTQFLINTYTSGGQTNPSVASLANGGFVVTWASSAQDDGTDGGIYGQEYDANGNPLGTEFLVNTFTDNSQLGSSVASLTDGRFVVSWQSEDQDGSGYGIYGQIFGQAPSVGVFEIDKLARSGFISDFSFTPIEVNGLPLGSLYDETYYLSQNPDVVAAVNSGVFINGYDHFVNFGGIEGRNPSLLYNETFYLFENPDVAAAVSMGTIASGSIHYALYGQQEGRSPSELFDEQAYRLQNPDVNDAITNGGFRSGFEHYLKYGNDEGRLPNNFLYNEAYYLSQNPDVAAAINTGIFEDGFAHYISFGQTERRNPSSLFNENQYLTLNPDVANAVNADQYTSGFEHYILYGRAENRTI